MVFEDLKFVLLSFDRPQNIEIRTLTKRLNGLGGVQKSAQNHIPKRLRYLIRWLANTCEDYVRVSKEQGDPTIDAQYTSIFLF